ncbi:PREDICTED: uncharacterized protein LOC109478643, partial [Branchiostoma belcheri]|uniref:Uncharacterized protein LOC109478643 n=1 Tax=Branchiostoma belcheri TaxID=7741 RepID=A0A6P4ZY12_BRABE
MLQMTPGMTPLSTYNFIKIQCTTKAVTPNRHQMTPGLTLMYTSIPVRQTPRNFTDSPMLNVNKLSTVNATEASTTAKATTRVSGGTTPLSLGDMNSTIPPSLGTTDGTTPHMIGNTDGTNLPSNENVPTVLSDAPTVLSKGTTVQPVVTTVQQAYQMTTRQKCTKYKTETVREDHTLRLSCPVGQSLVIDEAVFRHKNRRAKKSLLIMWNACQGLQRCSVRASIRVFGDPAYGYGKTLQAKYRCLTACSKPFGMISHVIPDDRITASSYWEHGPHYEPYRARVRLIGGAGSGTWAAGNNIVGEWLQVFKSNTDANTPVINLLDYPIYARYVRFVVQSWQQHIGMRVEILGCSKNVGDCEPNPCANGGTCLDHEGGFDCACPPPFYGKNCSIVCQTPIRTKSRSGYHWTEKPLTGSRFMFDVKATSDVIVALSYKKKKLDDMYEILIGGMKNTKSAICRSKSDILFTTAETFNFVSPTEFRMFWITWSSDGTIAVGRENETQPFLEYKDPNPLPIIYAGLRYNARDKAPACWYLCHIATPE